MTMKIRSALAALVMALALPAHAVEYEYTDLWWNPAESGWGLTVTHQGNTVFLAFFLFGDDGKATWFTSPASFSQRDSNLNPIYTGALFQVTGPYFGVGFNPAAVKAAAVGTATFAVTSDTTANLGYTVNGVAVNKALSRQTFKANGDVNGEYLGGLVAEDSGCAPTQPGLGASYVASTEMSFSGTAAQTVVVVNGASGCTTTGPYIQEGRLGRVVGRFVCPDNRMGTATFNQIEANRAGVRARYSVRWDDGCFESGHLTGSRRLGSP